MISTQNIFEKNQYSLKEFLRLPIIRFHTAGKKATGKAKIFAHTMSLFERICYFEKFAE